MRVIGIGGRSFCGSTILSKLFGAVPGVASVGEAHWILHDPRGRGKCRLCRGDCRVFSKLREYDTSTRPKNFYRRLLQSYGKGFHTLVTSDKAILNFKNFVPKGEMDCIILFRSPHGTVESDLKRGVRTTNEALDMWHERYRDLLTWSERWCQKTVVVDFEVLCEDYRAMMRVLLRELGLFEDAQFPTALNSIPVHLVATNDGAAKANLIRSVKDWKLPQDTVDYIDSCGGVMRIYKTLCERAIKL